MISRTLMLALVGGGRGSELLLQVKLFWGMFIIRNRNNFTLREVTLLEVSFVSGKINISLSLTGRSRISSIFFSSKFAVLF